MGFTGFEVVVGWDRAMRKGGLSWSQNPKPSRRGSVFGQRNVGGGLFSGRGDPIWQAYTGFEVLGWCNRAMREGGLSWSQNPKLSCWGSVLANEMWGSLF